MLKVLPNLDGVATGTLSPGDQILLSAYAEHTADRVWAVCAASLLAALDTGRDLGSSPASWPSGPRTSYPARWRPSSVISPSRATQLTDLWHARVIECADPARWPRSSPAIARSALCAARSVNAMSPFRSRRS
jgi:hypothetical protein